jgi:hypothetical protein
MGAVHYSGGDHSKYEITLFVNLLTNLFLDDLSGMWKVAGISASSGAFNYNMTLTQNEDGSVSGVVKSMGMKIEGKYNGTTFTFTQVSVLQTMHQNPVY